MKTEVSPANSLRRWRDSRASDIFLHRGRRGNSRAVKPRVKKHSHAKSRQLSRLILKTHRLSVFRAHHAGEIWKRSNHRSFWICVWGKHGQANIMIIHIVTSWLSKSLFSAYTKTQSRRFKIPSGFKSGFEKLCFRIKKSGPSGDQKVLNFDPMW